MPATRTVATATAFLDSIGSNTKGGMYLDGYRNSSLMLESLNYIGVDKVRDTFPEFGQARPVIDDLAAAGIQFNLRVNYTLPARDGPGLDSYLGALKGFIALHPGSVISVEGVNEANINTVSHEGAVGLPAAVDFQRDLHRAMKSDPAFSGVKLVNLSIANEDLVAYGRIGDLGRYSDAANAHSYTHTGARADAQMEATFALARSASEGDPLVVTELGHTTLSTEPGIGTSETAQAKLLLSNLLLSFENGAQTTYIYDLIDTPSSASRAPKEAEFGIFEEDGTPKLAAKALHNLNAILSHGDTGEASATPAVYSLSNAPPGTHSMQLAKSGGVYDIVVWADVPVFDDVTNRDIVNPATSVRVDLGRTEDVVRVYDPLAGMAPVAEFRDTSAIDVPLRDHPLVIEVGARTAVEAAAPPAIADTLTMSSASFVAQMATLAKASGLKAIKLTDGNVLQVSSVETMNHMIENHASLLAKVEGTLSFEVAYGTATWRKVQTYDERGRAGERTDYGLESGEVKSKIVYHVDGSYDTYNYAITGREWTNVHQSFDAGHKLTLLERLRDDGSMVYREKMLDDGGKRFGYYDGQGDLATYVKVAPNGFARTTLTYEAETGKLASQTVLENDGDIVTTRWTNGVKTAYDIVSHQGWKQNVTYDATTGKILTNLSVRADGAACNKTYVDGVVSKINARLADGSLDTWTFGIKDRPHVTEHQTTDPDGRINLIERLHADGTLDYREMRNADGSRTISTHDARGSILTDALVRKDGSTVFEKRLQDGSGDVLTERSGPSGNLLTRNVEHIDGGQDVFAFSDGQTLTGGRGDDIFNFRTTTSGKAVYEGGHDTVLHLDGGNRLVLDDAFAKTVSDLDMAQQGQDVLIRFDSDDTLLIKGMTVAELHKDFFLLT